MNRRRCECRGYDTSQGCPVHDPHYSDDDEDPTAGFLYEAFWH